MIIVMGLPGAGKTTVLNMVGDRHPEYIILNYGTLMLEIAKNEFGISDRDEIRKSSSETQREIQKRVGLALAEKKGKYILDTHCSILNPDKKFYLPGLPMNLLTMLKVDYLVLITADPVEIAQRRMSDNTRKRNPSIDEIRSHDNFNRYILAAYSAISGAPAKIILNKNGGLEEAVRDLESIL